MPEEFYIDKDNYLESYKYWTWETQEIWKDKNRAEMQADIWYNRMRNQTALDMIGDLAKDKKLIDVGTSPCWVDNELLPKLGVSGIVKNDIIFSEGIDLVADACELPVEDESFDFIICRELVEHVIDANALLNEMYRILRKDGYMYIATPNAYNCRPNGTWHQRGYSPDMFLKTLRAHKFKVIKKTGDVPGIHYALIHYARLGNKAVLGDFKKIQRMVEKMKDSYYIGSHLSVLVRK